MFTIKDMKTLPTDKWFHLFAAYLEKDYEEFIRSCKEYDINDEWAWYVCALGYRVIPRRTDYLPENNYMSNAEVEKLKKEQNGIKN